MDKLEIVNIQLPVEGLQFIIAVLKKRPMDEVEHLVRGLEMQLHQQMLPSSAPPKEKSDA